MEKTARCKTSATILGISLLLQVLYVVVEAIILVLQRPLKSLLSTGAWEVFEQNLFPIMDIARIIFMLALHTGLFILLWSQAENRSLQIGRNSFYYHWRPDFGGKSNLPVRIDEYGICGTGRTDVGQLFVVVQFNGYGTAFVPFGMGAAGDRRDSLFRQ